MKFENTYLAATAALFAVIGTTSQVQGAVILNEYNSVRADRWLDVDGLAASTASDSTFGRIVGNGGRWFEALVVGNTSLPGETIDMRGWSFDWTSTDVGSGSFKLTNDAALATVHRGTLLTFISEDVGGPTVPTNFGSYDPANGSWWLNINIADSQFVQSGSLSTGNGDWQLTIKNALDATVFGPVGEGVGSLSGVNSREVGKLEETHATIAGWQAVTPSLSVYNDGTSSSFGSENLWSNATQQQDFSALRVIPEPSSALLGAFGLLALLRRRR